MGVNGILPLGGTKYRQISAEIRWFPAKVQKIRKIM
jgi:hypothetical protein